MGKNTHFLLLSLCLLFASLNVSAGPITRSQAQQKAEAMMRKLGGNRKLSPVKSARKLAPHKGKATTTADETELYYVFNRGEGDGYVIMAGDDEFDTFLGYSDSGEFDYQEIPPAMREWLDDYADYIEAIQQAPNAAPKKLSAHPAIEPMVTTKWNQGDPYNQACPNYFHQGLSVTGCVATAMAQILYYQREKSVTEIQEDIPSYTLTSDKYGTMTVEGIPAGSPIDWNNMRNTYSSSSTAKEKKAVADLMLYCGVAVKMGYSNTSSGAYSSNVPDAVNKYFGYGNKLKHASQSNYSEESWDALVYKELSEGRPVYLSGHNDGGGHAFVADGYDGNQCYHINWGWGGSSDGYYMLSKLHPGSQGIGGSTGGYSNSREAVYGWEPDNYMSKVIPISNSTVKKLCVEAFDSDGDGSLTYGEVAAVESLGETFKGQTITSFPELYYFTGLTTLDENAFADCTRLTTVKLPKGLKRIGANAFANCRSLKTLQLPDELTEIGAGAFQDCRALTEINLPANITAIEANTFRNCAALIMMELPLGLRSIGDNAFTNCMKFNALFVQSVMPQQITLGSNVFENINMAEAQLIVPQGTGDYFRQKEQWRDFGVIYEQRTLSGGNYQEFEAQKEFYLYNLGTGKYLTRGEAYGTQAVVAYTAEPMRFVFRKTAYEDVYSIYSNDTGNTNHYLFRTTKDGKVGNGVKACFVDGSTDHLSDRTGHWVVKSVEGTEKVYTIQTPSDVSGYVATEYLGYQPSHESNAASPTYGAYSDIDYTKHPLNCQWMLVPYEKNAMNVFIHSETLKNLLAIALNKNVNITTEEVVYDNLNSTLEDIDKACVRLRKRMKLINFQDETVRQICIDRFDMDLDNEVSYTEIAAISELGSGFNNKSDIKAFPELEYFTHLLDIDGNAFNGDKELTELILPTNVTNIYYRAFYNCTKLESIHLSEGLEQIGDNAFYNCKALKEVYLPVANPSLIKLGTGVFTNAQISKAILYVPEGSKELYAEAATWKGFGEIREMRAMKHPGFVRLTTDTDLYVYNVGTRRLLNRGEAHGTQALVNKIGLIYQLRRSTSMASGTYYLYSEETGNSNKILFRTSTDGKVGKGVKACFVDGPTDRLNDRSAYWKVQLVEGKEGVYTFQVPQSDATYVEGEVLGTDYNHKTEVQTGTNGIYWDVNYEQNPENCQWSFVSVEAMQKARDFFNLTEQLRKLLAKANAQSLDITAEQTVYDNFQSTEQEISEAIQSLLNKLKYIKFTDSKAKEICTIYWDTDDDGEISAEEASAVTDISQAFRGISGMKSLEDLRHFTGITAIGNEGLRSNPSLISVILPKGVKAIGENAFTSCASFKYLAILNDTEVVSVTEASLPANKLRVFVPKNLMAAYQADEVWGKYTILEYTGKPIVAAVDTTRTYGSSNPPFEFEVTGAPVNGVPTIHTGTDAKTPIGTYPLTIEIGNITTPDVQLVNGTLTVEKAPLLIKARSYSRKFGEENPAFKLIYRTFVNDDKESVLLVAPTIECDATPESPAGDYEIRVFGAEAANYDITYEYGVLTVKAPAGVSGVEGDAIQKEYYDLCGRKANKPTRGIYIDKNQQKAVLLK